MNSENIILNEDSSKIFWAHEAWQNYCIKNKIQDPFKLIRDIEDEYHHYKEIFDEKGHHKGTEITIDDPTEEQQKRLKKAKEYRDSYMISREIWKGKYIFKNFGYNILSKFAQTHSLSETAPSYDKAFHQWHRTIHPCDGADGQCSFACPIFYNCALRDQGAQHPGVEV